MISIKQKVRNLLFKLDPKLKVEDKKYEIASILLASAFVGPNQKKIAKELSYSRKKLKLYGLRARKSKIWVGNKVHANWGDKEQGEIEFWCDVMTVAGMLKRVGGKNMNPIDDAKTVKSLSPLYIGVSF